MTGKPRVKTSKYKFHDADLSIGRAIRAGRERKNLTQKQLAEKAGVGTLQDISLLERGEKRFSVDDVIGIARALDDHNLIPTYLLSHGYYNRIPRGFTPPTKRRCAVISSIQRHPWAILIPIEIEYPLSRRELPSDKHKRKIFVRDLAHKIMRIASEAIQQKYWKNIPVTRSEGRILW